MNADAGLVAYQSSGRLRQIRLFNQLAIVFFMYPPLQHFHLGNQLVNSPYISLLKVCEILAGGGQVPNAVARCRSDSMKVGFAFLARRLHLSFLDLNG